MVLSVQIYLESQVFYSLSSRRTPCIAPSPALFLGVAHLLWEREGLIHEG